MTAFDCRVPDVTVFIKYSAHSDYVSATSAVCHGGIMLSTFPSVCAHLHASVHASRQRHFQLARCRPVAVCLFRSRVALCCRHVMLPKEISKLVPKNHLMTEEEWRGIGVQQSQGWQHYMHHGPGL